uniref:Uncharacterized protein n=1 Tax=Daphnia galeata TaxID=27404 RepID=A0A8J2S145_9CRUS|nr:unnamed protein product [Daphnia galeata]
MGNLTDNLDNSSMNSDNFERADERSARTRRFIPFYRPRKDNLSCFSEENLNLPIIIVLCSSTGNRHFTKTKDSSKEKFTSN